MVQQFDENNIWYCPAIWSFKQEGKLSKQPSSTDVWKKRYYIYFS